VRRRTLLVTTEKTVGRRSVRLLSPLAEDLAVWREASADPREEALLFPAEGGHQWTANGFEKWRQRRYANLLKPAGLSSGRPYDLRHSFASLLLHEGRDVIYVARQLGHGAELTLRTYGHVIEELEDSPQLPAEEAIRRCGSGRNTRRFRVPRAGFEPAAYSLGGSRSIRLSYRGSRGEFPAYDQCRVAIVGGSTPRSQE
jgi:hypothetical protein